VVDLRTEKGRGNSVSDVRNGARAQGRTFWVLGRSLGEDSLSVILAPADGPLGARPPGSPPVIGAAAATADAIVAATGRRFTDLSISSEVVYRAVGGGRDQ
jgi:hypothetical protein